MKQRIWTSWAQYPANTQCSLSASYIFKWTHSLTTLQLHLELALCHLLFKFLAYSSNVQAFKCDGDGNVQISKCAFYHKTYAFIVSTDEWSLYYPVILVDYFLLCQVIEKQTYIRPKSAGEWLKCLKRVLPLSYKSTKYSTKDKLVFLKSNGSHIRVTFSRDRHGQFSENGRRENQEQCHIRKSCTQVVGPGYIFQHEYPSFLIISTFKPCVLSHK